MMEEYGSEPIVMDPDSGGPKTYRSYGSGSEFTTLLPVPSLDIN
jgi:hypothetical protein